MKKMFEFIFGDSISRVYKVVIAIYGYLPGGSPEEGR